MRFLLPAILPVVIAGCDKFDGDQTIPAYVHVDTVYFTTDYSSQGTSKQNFKDIWVYVDDDLIGGFELPATIPILSEGPHKVEFRPGIILNGISDTRVPSPCIKPVTYENFELIPDSIITANVSSSYLSNVQYVWMEDFEDASLAIHETTGSDTNIVRTPPDSPDAFIDEDSQYSGISYLTKTHDYLELVSDDGNGEGFVFDRGDFVFLEMHYKFDVPVLIGMYIKIYGGGVQDRAFVVVTPSDEWKKIYINFTPIVNETVDANNFKIYFQAQLGAGDLSGNVMFDNLKLITRPNL